MPAHLADKFGAEFVLDADTVKENLYRKENPNTYLAKFAKFLIEHREDPYIQDIISNGLDRFIRHQVLQFDDAKNVPIHFVGSIAHFLQAEVEQALAKYDLTLGRVIKRPIDGLVDYHVKLLNLKQ